MKLHGFKGIPLVVLGKVFNKDRREERPSLCRGVRGLRGSRWGSGNWADEVEAKRRRRGKTRFPSIVKLSLVGSELNAQTGETFPGKERQLLFKMCVIAPIKTISGIFNIIFSQK